MENDFRRLKRICIIDGLAGGIGAILVKYLKEACDEAIELDAFGTNEIATAQMLRAGAARGATGENAICMGTKKADFIVGTIAITWANAMMGEITPKIAEAVMSSSAKKIFLPISRENANIISIVKGEPLPHLVQEAIQKIKEMIEYV